MDGFKLKLASDVLERDGLGLELYSPDGNRIAEIFRDDSTGERTFHSFGPLGLRPEILTWFLNEAARRL